MQLWFWLDHRQAAAQGESIGGDIPGFNGHVIRLPDDALLLCWSNGERALLNSEMVAQHAAAIAIGDPFPERKVIALALALDAFVGTYVGRQQHAHGSPQRGNPDHATRRPSGDRLEAVCVDQLLH